MTTDLDIRHDKARTASAARDRARRAFFAKGAHVDSAGDVVIPSPEPNKERTRLCKKYGFRYHHGEYPQWYRSHRWPWRGDVWTLYQWLELAHKIEKAVK